MKTITPKEKQAWLISCINHTDYNDIDGEIDLNETKTLNINADSRAELIEWLNNQPVTLFEKVVNMGIEWEFVPIVRGYAARFRNCIASGIKY